MYTILQLFSSVLFLTFSGPSDWQEFKSFEGRFRVLAPGVMTEKTDTVTTELGNLDYHVFYHQTDNKDADNLFYMISYTDYPEGSVHSDSTEFLDEFFQTTLESAAAAVDGEVIYSTDIEYKDFPGKFWH